MGEGIRVELEYVFDSSLEKADDNESRTSKAAPGSSETD